MKPTELSLFSESEQKILIATEPARLAKMTEDEIGDVLTLVRRARNKYSKLHRRQATTSISAAGKRSAARSSNTRTLRKAEIFEDALARVSTALAKAARVSRDELKKERLRAAGAASGAPRRASTKPAKKAKSAPRRPSRRTTKAAAGRGHVTERRAASTRATNARAQAKRDRSR